MIRDKVIREMKTMKELETYIESTEDSQLGMMVEIVKEYGNKIPGILKSLKDKHVSNEDKHKARIIFRPFTVVREWNMTPCKLSMIL